MTAVVVLCPRCASARLQGGGWCPACQDNTMTVALWRARLAELNRRARRRRRYCRSANG